MKRAFGIILVMLLLMVAGCGASEKAAAPQNILWNSDAEADFDGLYWGISPVEVRERVGKTLNENDGFYTVDYVEFGGFDCYKTYRFNDNSQLYEIGIEYISTTESMIPKLIEYLTGLYGEPEISELDTAAFKDKGYIYHSNDRTQITLSHVKTSTNDLVKISANYTDAVTEP